MANPAVTIDLLEGMAGSMHIIRGADIPRMAIVTGLASDGNGNYDVGGANTGQLYQRVLDAVSAVAPLSSGCPGVTVPNYLAEIGMPEFISPDVARCKLSYRGFPALQIEFNSSLAQVETNVDNQGNPITVVYAYPSNYSTITGGNPAYNGLSVTQGGIVSRPTSDVSFTVKFTTAGLTGVTSMAMNVGMVNQNAYPVGVIPGAPRTWLCTGFRALSEDGGLTYNAALSLQYRAAKWDNPIMFINPDTGKPPPDLISGTGYKTPQIALATSFPTLI